MRALHLNKSVAYLNAQVVDDFGNIIYISGGLFIDAIMFEYSDRSPMLGTDLTD